MDNRIFAICDGEEVYAHRMMEYLSGIHNFPFQIHVFTKRQKLYSYAIEHEVECLLISESLYDEDLKACMIRHIIMLNESGTFNDESILNINKYQSSEIISRTVLNYYAEKNPLINNRQRTDGKELKIIGIYSPVKRCLQTTFSMTLGQIIAQRNKVLYLNFENYSGMSKLLCREFQSDLSDLLYFFNCVKERFAYQLKNIVETVNGMDFIPPAFVYPDLMNITGEQWLELLNEMERVSDYEYLILDLSDYVTGLFGILRKCHQIYTITRDDPIAEAKIEQYEKLLCKTDYQDISLKTKKCRFPVFKQLPIKFDLLTYGELASYIKSEIIKDLYDDV